MFCYRDYQLATRTRDNDNISEDVDSNSGEDNEDSKEHTIRENWVRNISKTPLMEAQETLLANGPKFVVVPKELPTSEYIAAIENAWLKLDPCKAEELRGEIEAILKKKTNNKPNISKEEYWAIKELRNDNTKIVFTADKGCPWWLWTRKTTSTNLKNYYSHPRTRS